MKIIFKKTGRFSINPVNGPIIECKRGATIELPDDQGKQLVNSDWAETQASIREKEKPPWKRKNWNSDDSDAKQQLIDYCQDLFEVSLDKRRAVSTLIKDIRKLIKENDR